MRKPVFLFLFLFAWIAYSQPPAPEDIVQVVATTFAPDTVSQVTVHVHNKSNQDITYLSGLLTYNPYGLRPVQARCSVSTLEHWAQLTHPLTRANVLKNVEKAKAEGKKADLGTFNKGEDLTFDCGTRPTKIQEGTASFSPDTVIFADQTWSGDQNQAMNEYRLRKQKSLEYGKLLGAILDGEKTSDPLKRYQEILQQWLPDTGIKEYADHTTITGKRGGGDPAFAYHELESYANEYKQFAQQKAAMAAHPEVKMTPTLDEQFRSWIDQIKRRYAAISATYHKHSEPK